MWVHCADPTPLDHRQKPRMGEREYKMEEKTPHPLLLNPAVHQELTRRAAIHAEPGQDNHWAEYFLLLDLCQQIVAGAPASVAECNACDIETRLGEDLSRLASAICQILPGGMVEFRSYLPRG